MNISIGPSRLYFKVERSGANSIVVRDGCIFYWSGDGTEIATGFYNAGVIPAIRMPQSKFSDFGDEYPGDSKGRHVLIPEQEFTVSSSSILYLRIPIETEEMDWSLSVTDDTGDIIPDGPYESINAAYDTGVSVSMTAKIIYPLVDNTSYEVIPSTDPSNGLIPIAEVEVIRNDLIIKQLHEGIIFLGREIHVKSDSTDIQLI